MDKNVFFYKYFEEWIDVYKQGAVRPVTYQKYIMTLRRLTEIAPTLKVCDLDRRSYQNLINEYAKTHEKQTVTDFHHHLKSVILDIIDEGLLTVNPTRKVTIKGKAPNNKKPKFLSQFQFQALLKNLSLLNEPNWDWLILLVAKTGLRFSEALGLTPNDFDFSQQTLKVTKTWNYKSSTGGFTETKNASSKRTIPIDPRTNNQFSELVKDLPTDEPIFVHGRVFNSAVNSRLQTLCKEAGVPVISVHCLRHTHASLLMYARVSIASVAKRLGHANTTTTQETYLHIVNELEARDNDKIIQYLEGLA